MEGARSLDEFGLEGAMILDRYVIEEAVAAGGFGVVYRSRHALLGSEVAIKVLKVPGHFGELARVEFIRMFLREAQIIASLRHPAIVRVLDFGAVRTASGDEVPWMALEWIHGVQLSDDLTWRRGNGGRTPREALALLAPVVEALAEAHERGIAHRDVKPANMMIPSSEASRSVRSAAPSMRLLDFGIAKVMEEGEGPGSGVTQTVSAMPAFSVKYASPEQVGGARTGPWTDVHALGLIFTEVLTDRAPYEGADKFALSVETMSPTRPTPGRFGVDVGAWEPILAKAVALKPVDRFGSAGEFLAALESSLPSEERGPHADLASTPRAPSLTPAPTETDAPLAASRSRVQKLAIAVTLVLLAAIAAVSTYGLDRVKTSALRPSEPRSERPSPPTAPPSEAPPPSPMLTASQGSPAVAAPITQTLAITPAHVEAPPNLQRRVSVRSNARPPTVGASSPARPLTRSPASARGASLHDRPDLE